MVDIFEDKMCNYCKKSNCEKKIIVTKNSNITIYKCEEYKKNKLKIAKIEKPLIVTAKRKYINFYER